jgi:hypothetical protein
VLFWRQRQLPDSVNAPTQPAATADVVVKAPETLAATENTVDTTAPKDRIEPHF